MISAVLDANIITSGILGYRNPVSIPGAILRLWRQGTFILATSKHIRDEVKVALSKSYFKKHLTIQEISRIQALLQFQAKQTVITEDVHETATHFEDDLVLAVVVSAKADYLVTGDGPLLRKVGNSYQGVKLVNPNDFLQILKQQS
ncbi:MAG: PilT protein [uncultured bacterium]|uniref:PIN domain-containing protein n=1 Tax=Candidatus Daviesbacteria bacterium GW2011_GWC2_40_12 TaxID=1618431 RepID=A0A0G0QX96_9BACT|nr:MAG: PilT protein [uncultured bacterium]KKR16982.1 MAG: hypothetical protein UT45_C0003G0012 [Candidatus Daviesbacteria bacterium GW2011_GWA2_39_33]KKR25427.1 MAG: hypothetical protein UT54_C0002G0010 [Candidatus Daviesbacteria bacterium GW2011_GWB1_39_5]KKR42046.1 MAG: hypothetical protein UT77_C0004G0030 [Candidatus Daviesbacteria bacterium GW2011_GWC2_40_12]OGE20814.1 MAG: putative toxin-antitoxin system toxin component, PIN family [Candidatus Daviesbacteria bacterium RIFCSPHIGHO2_01_FULL